MVRRRPCVVRTHRPATSAGWVQDRRVEPIGVRTIALDRDPGLLLNGQPILLWGGCVDHDDGVLGAATLAAATRRLRPDDRARNAPR